MDTSPDMHGRGKESIADHHSRQLAALQRLADTLLTSSPGVIGSLLGPPGAQPTRTTPSDSDVMMADAGTAPGPSNAIVLYNGNNGNPENKRQRANNDEGKPENHLRDLRENGAESLLKGKRRKDQNNSNGGKQPTRKEAPASDFEDSDDEIDGLADVSPSGPKPQIPTDDDGDDDEDDDDASDARTIATLYDDKQPVNDEVTIQMLKLLEALVQKVDHIVNAPSPSHPVPIHGRINPVVANRLAIIPKRTRTTTREGNFQPWSQDVNDNRPTGARTREPARTAILAYIRICLMKALKRKSSKSLLPPGPPDDMMAPSLNSFFIKWKEAYRSEFNSIACQLITDQVLRDWPTLLTHHNWDDVFKMVSAHVKYLILTYRRQNLPSTDTSELERHRRASANRRMHTTFDCRMHVIDSIPALKRHRRLLQDLGIEGTSSDEEDTEPKNAGTYKVKKIKQLSKSVRELKRKLDEAYQMLEKKPSCKGGRSRKRVRTNDSSTRKFRIKGLPINCVNSIWYARLTETQKAYYRFADYKYDFSFPDEILNM